MSNLGFRQLAPFEDDAISATLVAVLSEVGSGEHLQQPFMPVPDRQRCAAALLPPPSAATRRRNRPLPPLPPIPRHHSQGTGE